MNWDKIKNKMNEKQDGAIESSDEKTSENKKPHLTVPYASFVKYITEKYGLGDAEDFQRRINAINRFKNLLFVNLYILSLLEFIPFNYISYFTNYVNVFIFYFAFFLCIFYIISINNKKSL